MNSLAIEAISAQKLRGYQAPLSAVSVTGQYKVEQNSVDGLVYLTENGGAWAHILSGAGAGVTLDGAYNFGGAGAGRTITTTTPGGAVQINNTQTTGTIFGITHTGAIATAGLTAVSIDLSAAGTFATPTTFDVPAITITGAYSSIAKKTTTALVSIFSSYRNATAFLIRLKNKQALAGSAVVIGWDATNYEGVVNSTTLTGQTHMVTLDGQNCGLNPMIAGAQEFVNLRILVPDSTNINTRGISVESIQTNGNGVVVALTGTLSAATTGYATTYAGTSGGNRVWGYFANVGAGVVTATGADSACFVGAFYGNTTTRGVIWAGTDAVLTTTGSYLLYRGSFNATMTLGAGLDGIALDLFSNVTAGGQIVRGVQVYIASGASTASYAALFDYRNLAGTAAGNGIVNINTNINGSTTGVLTFLEIGSDTATLTLGAAVTGINVDLATSITGNQQYIGMKITTGATNTAAANDVAALVVKSRYSAGRAVDFTIRNTSTSNGAILLARYDSATATTGSVTLVAVSPGISNGLTLGAALIGIDSNLSGNVTHANNSIIGYRLTLPATARVDTAAEGAVVIASSATAMRMIDCAVGNTSAATGLWVLRWGTAANLAAATTCLTIDATTNVTPGAQNIIGLQMTLPATTAASSRSVAAIYIDNRAEATSLIEASIRNKSGFGYLLQYGAPVTTNGTIILQYLIPGANNTVTLGAAITGYAIDMSTGMAGLTNVVRGLDIILPATSNAASYGMSVVSAMTAGVAISITMTGVGGNNDHLQFVSVVDGTGAHLRGPAGGNFVQKAGVRTTNGVGRGFDVYAGAGLTTGAGGAVSLYGGDAAGAANDNGGAINLQPGVPVGTGRVGGLNIGSAGTPCWAEMWETTLPAVASANGGRLFLVDSGGGKTVLKIIFQSGAAQTIATEP